MASVVLSTVGSAVGNALLPGIGGAFLGSLGRGVGGLIDAQLGLGTRVTGPRLQNLNVQDSRYGASIPSVYGRARVAGNVIWSTDLVEAQHTSQFSGGKGGGSSTTTTTYSYSVHCAVGVALGEIGGINTIWADSKIIYQDGVWVPGTVDSASIYLGSTAQSVDPFMESILGSGNVPAYRGVAYVVFDNLQLANFGNRLPNLTFEILPLPSSSNPEWLGEVDASVSQRAESVKSGTMGPLVVEGSTTQAQRMLVGGYALSGSDYIFEVVEYDVTDETPVEIARTQSTSFTATTPTDTSWALAADGRTVALYLQTSSSPTHYLAVYDLESRQFGEVYSVDLTTALTIKQVAWIDSQHFVIDDVDSGHRGLRVFTRAGLDVVDLGFFSVWGAGTSTALAPFYGAQFTAFAGGLLAYVYDTSTPGFLTMYVRPLAWRNNTLSVSDPYTLVSGLVLGVGSGPHANFVRTGSNEWTLWYSEVLDYRLVSFEPGLISASITRPWQVITPSFGVGSSQFPLCYGNRLVLVQRSALELYYRVSEVSLDAGSFTLVVDAAITDNNSALTFNFSAARIDSERLLLMGCGGVVFNIGQLGILKRGATGSTVGAIVSDLLDRAGYDDSDYDVTALDDVTVDGYVIQETTTARAAIEPLQVYLPFDLVESGDQLIAMLRDDTAVATIPASEWRAAHEDKEPPPAMDITRAQELDLPLEVAVDYIDAARDFEVNSQRARRIVTRAKAVQKIALPIVCATSTAKQIAETRLFTAWAERDLVRIYMSRRYLALDPGDVIDLDNGQKLRVTNINQAGGLMEIEGFFVYAAAQISSAAGDKGRASSFANNARPDSTLYLMDLPLLQAADDQPGVYTAVTGLPGWTGASLWRASDGVSYTNIANYNSSATSGLATSVLDDGPTCYMDRINTIDVQIINGSLSSCSEADLLNGANAAVLGDEIIQFQTATLIGPGHYTLSNLLRGRRGTEGATASHVVGENFVFLSASTVNFIPALLTDRNADYEFRALTRGQTLGDVQDTNFTYGLATIQPFAPVNVGGARASGVGSDLTITWKRRARLNADWIDHVDVPLDEPSELYELEIMDGSNVIRTYSGITSPTQLYSAADQTTDWGGSPPSTYTVNIYQISSRYGRGRAAAAVI